MRLPHPAAVAAAAVLVLAGCAADGGTGSAGPSTSSDPAPTTTTATGPSLPAGADPVLGAAAPDLTALVLTAPADLGPCPDAAEVLSAVTGTRIVYWQGDLSGSGPGCQWADIDTVTTQTFVEQRYWVGITFDRQVDPTLLLQDPAQGRPECTATPGPLGVPLTSLTRCTSVSSDGDGGVGDTTWTYLQADSSGAGVWELAVAVGSRYPGDAEQLASAGLAAITQAAESAFGAR